MRCTVKSSLLTFMNEYPSFIVFSFENVHKNIFYVEICPIIYQYRVVLKLSLYPIKGLNFTNGISIEIFIRECVYLMILKFLDITDKQNTQKRSESKIKQHIPYTEC